MATLSTSRGRRARRGTLRDFQRWSTLGTLPHKTLTFYNLIYLDEAGNELRWGRQPAHGHPSTMPRTPHRHEDQPPVRFHWGGAISVIGLRLCHHRNPRRGRAVQDADTPGR